MLPRRRTGGVRHPRGGRAAAYRRGSRQALRALVSEAATVTDERRCLGVNQDGSPCGVSSELLMPSGWCFGHDPARGLDRSAAGTRAGYISASRRRRGIDVGELNSAADAKRIVARLVVAIAAGELPAAQGRAALSALETWLKAYDMDELEQRLAELGRERRERP